ncbi:unnamed protein product [Knipowitschia caucasica]
MVNLKTKLQQRYSDSFFGMETSALLQNIPNQEARKIKTELANFYTSALAYLEKWYDFSDGNYQKHVASLSLKSQFNFSQLCDAVEILQLKSKINLDDLYEEYCSTMSYQLGIVERKVPVPERWELLLKGKQAPNMSVLASFLLSIPITNAAVERVFSHMTAAWTDQRNRSSVELIKSEIQIKNNFNQSCKDFYSYALKDKAMLECAQCSRKYKLKKKL